MASYKIAFLCDGMACGETCLNPINCHHTVDIDHAAHFMKLSDGCYIEVIDDYVRSIHDDISEILDEMEEFTDGKDSQEQVNMTVDELEFYIDKIRELLRGEKL